MEELHAPKPEDVKLRLTWGEFFTICYYLVDRVTKLDVPIDIVAGIPRGGLIPAVIFSHALGKPLEIVDLSKGICKPSKTVLVVEDISDTGETLGQLAKRSCVSNWIDVCIVSKPETSWKPKLFGIECTEWVVFPWEAK